jgi:hypothetical protein
MRDGKQETKMDSKTVETTIKTLIETQIIQALNNAPEAVEKMVKAAMSEPVDPRSGKNDGYSSHRVPYLEYMVGNEIRSAATEAARKVIQEKMPDIEAEVRKGLSSESLVAAVTKSLIGVAEQEWRISVKFEGEKERH